MVNICELLINIVKPNEPKEVDRLKPKMAMKKDNLLGYQIAQTRNLPVDRQDLNFQC